MRKVFAILIVTVILFVALSQTVFACDSNTSVNDNDFIDQIYTIPEGKVLINPDYVDIITPEDVATTLQNNVVYSASDIFYNLECAAEYVRKQMTGRNSRIEFVYRGSESTNEIFQKALEHTGVPNEGDYLRKSWTACSFSSGNNGARTISLQYFTTAEQENEVSNAVTKVLNSLDLDSKNDFEKIEAIYDWVGYNVSYDWEHFLFDDGYKLQYTAYAAIINGTAVCEGYALLLYRMLLETGIDCRYISGLGDGEPHAWNIVRLNDKYYNVDITWDAVEDADAITNLIPELQGGFVLTAVTYEYFLKCNVNFKNHIRDAEYDTPMFNAGYPMSDEDCNKYHIHDVSFDIFTYIIPTCTEVGYAGDVVCLSCGKFLNLGMTMSALGHEYSISGFCVRCGVEKPPFDPGDLNGDGNVNINDAIELLKYIAKLDNNVVNESGTDINGDGVVNINDAIALLKQIAGLS